MSNFKNDPAEADEMQRVARMTAMSIACHLTALKKQPLRYIDYLCDALKGASISTPLPEVLAQLVPGMSYACALEMMDMKFFRFSGGGDIERPVLPSRQKYIDIE